MKVYALVGKSGTGKSFQAMNLCRSRNISSIIDDGLFIKGSNILAGTSAKRQATKIGAVKTALFTKEEHRKQVADKIKEVAPKSILIIGTSDRMVKQISQRLELKEIDEIIYIEDITTKEEREVAYKQRHDLGKHVIPVPTFQLQKDFSGYFIDTLKTFMRRGSNDVITEKSVVRPTYSYLGEYIIAQRVIESIVEHTAKDVVEINYVTKISTISTGTGIIINMVAYFEYGVCIPMIARELQQKVLSRVNIMTAFNVDAVNIEGRINTK